jgi:hypothetical protein
MKKSHDQREMPPSKKVESEPEVPKSNHQTSIKRKESFKTENKISNRKSDSSDSSYEHIYCEIESPSKPKSNANKNEVLPNTTSYTNCGQNTSSILDIQPLKAIGQSKVSQPVRPTRNKTLKKATSLDSDDSRFQFHQHFFNAFFVQ